MADQQALAEPAVPNRDRPGEQDGEALVSQARDIGWQPDRVGDPAEDRRQDGDHLDARQDGAQAVGEAAQCEVAVPVPDERRCCGHQHDDRRFDDDREREGDPESGEVFGRVSETRDDRRQIRALDGHHEPRAGEGEPEGEDLSVGERRAVHAEPLMIPEPSRCRRPEPQHGKTPAWSPGSAARRRR